MKIKNIIITRYFNVDGVYGDEMYTFQFLYKHFDTFKNNLINSLNNIDDNKFELIVLIHEKVNPETVQFIKDLELQTKYYITILHLSELNDYVAKYNDQFDYIVQSRMDFDDFVYKDVIEDINSQIFDTTTIKLYGYLKGFTYLERTKEFYRFYHIQNTTGHWAVMSSLIYSTKYMKDKPALNIYNMNHGRSKINLETWCKKNNIEFNDDMFVQNKTTDAFIYYRPSDSWSELMVKNQNIEYKLPGYTNKKIERPQKLKEKFGFQL